MSFKIVSQSLGVEIFEIFNLQSFVFCDLIPMFLIESLIFALPVIILLKGLCSF